MEYEFFYSSPVGILRITESAGAITRLEFASGTAPTVPGTPLLALAEGQLDEYFAGTRREFDLPLRPSGTRFRTAVWRALTAIPYGETRSYGDIAREIGNPRGVRAVGQANNRNPISVIIPCHRVIGSDGSLVGYGGGLEIKRFLLEHESRFK